VREAGQVVDANLGDEHGRNALESIALGLRCADFNLAEEPVAGERPPLIAEADRVSYMTGLCAESDRLAKVIPTLSCVPRFVDQVPHIAAEGQLTLRRSTLCFIPRIAAGQTVEKVARERGLARTLRDVADLVEGGLVWLDVVHAERETLTPPRESATLSREAASELGPPPSAPEARIAVRPLASLRNAFLTFFVEHEPATPSIASDRLKTYQRFASR
jgi:hypothetical protein